MKRVLTALVLIPSVTYLILWAPQLLFLLALAVIAGLCFFEFDGLVSHHAIPRPGLLGYVAGLLLLVTPDSQLAFLGLFVILGMALALRLPDLSEALPYAGALVLGVLYVFGGWRSAALLRAVSPYWLLFAVALNWAGDIAAYYVGRAFGRHRLAPRVSPGKSWEGSVGLLVASVLFALVYFPLSPARRPAHTGGGDRGSGEHRRTDGRSLRVGVEKGRGCERQRHFTPWPRRLAGQGGQRPFRVTCGSFPGLEARLKL